MAKIPRCDIQDHLLVCPLSPVECKYSALGCLMMPLRMDSEKHHLEPHTEVLIETCSRLLCRIEQEREETKAEQNNLQRQINYLNTELNNTRDDLQRQHDLLYGKVYYDIDDKLGQLIVKHEKLRSDYNQLKEEHSKLLKTMTAFILPIVVCFLLYLWFKKY